MPARFNVVGVFFPKSPEVLFGEEHRLFVDQLSKLIGAPQKVRFFDNEFTVIHEMDWMCGGRDMVAVDGDWLMASIELHHQASNTLGPKATLHFSFHRKYADFTLSFADAPKNLEQILFAFHTLAATLFSENGITLAGYEIESPGDPDSLEDVLSFCVVYDSLVDFLVMSTPPRVALRDKLFSMPHANQKYLLFRVRKSAYLN